MPSQSHSNPPDDQHKGGKSKRLPIGDEMEQLIRKTTGGNIDGLRDLLNKFQLFQTPALDEDLVYTISAKYAKALHELMHAVADLVKLNGKAIDRSNIGPTLNAKTLPLLIAGITNLCEVLKQRDSQLEIAARGTLDEIAKNKDLTAQLKAAKTESAAQLRLLGDLAEQLESLQRSLDEATKERDFKKLENEAIKTEASAQAQADAKRIEELSEEVAKLTANLDNGRERLRGLVDELGRTQSENIILRNTQLPALPPPDRIAAMIDASPAHQLALRGWMSADYRVALAHKFKNPEARAVALFANDDIQAVVAAWQDCWNAVAGNGSPFDSRNFDIYPDVEEAFNSRVEEDDELRGQLEQLNLVRSMGKTLVTQLVGEFTLTRAGIEKGRNLLKFDPRFLTILIDIEPGLPILTEDQR